MMRAAVAAALVGALSGPAFAEGGAELFEDNCAACHNSGGIGTPGLAPPLDRPDFWGALGEDAATYVNGVVTKGFNMSITIRGERYMGMPMIPVATATDEELAQISTWVLAELGGLDQPVSAEDIAAMRKSDMANAGLKALRPKIEE